MCITLPLAVLAFGPGAAGAAPPREERKPDILIEIRVKDGKLAFVRPGQDGARPVTAVVGQTLRLSNLDTRAHAVASTVTREGKPLFSTGMIKPGDYKDIPLDIDLYRRAGGRPANVVTLKFHCDGQPSPVGELQLLSAAKRGFGRP